MELQARHFAGGTVHMCYARILRCQNKFCTAASYGILANSGIVMHVRNLWPQKNSSKIFLSSPSLHTRCANQQVSDEH